MDGWVPVLPDDAPRLTPLQREVLILVGGGLTNREIAARLGTTPGRIGTQVGRIVQRLGLTRRSEIEAAVSGPLHDGRLWMSPRLRQ